MWLTEVIGAGLNDVTLQNDTYASIGFLNGTYQQFEFDTDFPWSMSMGGDTNYAGMLFTSPSFPPSDSTKLFPLLFSFLDFPSNNHQFAKTEILS